MPHPPPQHVPTLTEVVHEGKRLFQVPHPVPSEAGALATGETRGRSLTLPTNWWPR